MNKRACDGESLLNKRVGNRKTITKVVQVVDNNMGPISMMHNEMSVHAWLCNYNIPIGVNGAYNMFTTWFYLIV